MASKISYLVSKLHVRHVTLSLKDIPGTNFNFIPFLKFEIMGREGKGYTPLHAYYITKKIYAPRVNRTLSLSSTVFNSVQYLKKGKSIFPWRETNFHFQILLLDCSYFKSNCLHISYESNTQAL